MPTERQTPEQTAENFISRWEMSGSAERANCQIFLSELCCLIGVPPPEPATPDVGLNAYVFERAVNFNHGDGAASTDRISDLLEPLVTLGQARKLGTEGMRRGKPIRFFRWR